MAGERDDDTTDMSPVSSERATPRAPRPPPAVEPSPISTTLASRVDEPPTPKPLSKKASVRPEAPIEIADEQTSADPASMRREPESDPPLEDPPSDLDVPDPDALAEAPDVAPPAPLPSSPGYAPSAPVVTTVKPTRIDSRGGTPVTVFGAGFVPGCRVFVGEEELIAEVLDAFTIRFHSPALTGNLELVVESPSGKRSEPRAIELVEGPTILRAIPSEGPTEGGIEVVLEGRGFSTGCTVGIFGMHAPDAVFESEQRIKFVLPPAGDGPLEGTLTVTLFDGLMGRAEGIFRYRPLAPAIEAIEPNQGWITGSRMIAIRGQDFHPKAAVRVGGRAAVTHFRSATHVDAEVPPADAPGLVTVIVENPDKRAATLEEGFRYEPVPAPPKIIDVFPKRGLITGGETIRIVGDNFTETVRVRIGDLTAVRRVMSTKLIDADVPPRQLPGLVAVEVVLEDIVVRAEEAFTYVSPRAPKITSVEPRSGPTGGKTVVVIEGENFMKGATVRFGGEASKFVVVKSDTRIEAHTPPSKGGGLVDIEVSAVETGPGVAPKAFRYEAMLAPTIASISPPRGTVDGGTELSIEGKNFAEGCAVLVGGAPVKMRRISGSVLEAYTPGGDDGKLVDIAVKNPDGQTAIQKRAFQYDARYRS